jgi:hypothetical protein
VPQSIRAALLAARNAGGWIYRRVEALDYVLQLLREIMQPIFLGASVEVFRKLKAARIE